MKHGLCIGINYAGKDHALNGCINDAETWDSLLADNGFHTRKLLEADATYANMRSSFINFMAMLKPGDIGCITYSGHGTWVPDNTGDESDGRDEALVPHDMGDDGENLFLDDEISSIFGSLPYGANLIFLTDCCHSGTIYRMMPSKGKRKVRFLPPASFVKSTALTAKMDRAFGQPVTKRAKAMPGVIHISGCRDTEYSIDAEIDGVPCGAFTYVAHSAFGRAKVEGLTYNDTYRLIRESLPNMEFPQTPVFNASAALKKTKVFTVG